MCHLLPHYVWRPMKRALVIIAAIALTFGFTASAPAQAAETQIATKGVFAGTAAVDCSGRGCVVTGISSTCVVAGTVNGLCSVAFALNTAGAECSSGTGNGQGSFSAAGTGATVPLTAANTGRSITASGSAFQLAENRLITMTISIPAHICQGNYPFSGTVEFVHASA